MKERLIISVTVGYMLKVLKSGIAIEEQKREFDAIRHGDYVKFINLVGGPMPYILSYHEGVTSSGYLSPQKDDIDFALLLKAGPSLKIFLLKCFATFGTIEDLDLSDEIFELLATFEINLRMHASNNRLITVEDRLVSVIDKLGSFKSIPLPEINEIHLGRKFLNMVKHNRNQFQSWSDGVAALQTANKILDKHNLTSM